jgi:cell division protein FtsI/penicillin-binding protein 2
VVSTTPRRRPLLDAAGRPLQTPSTAYVIGVRPDRLVRPRITAQRLGQITGLQPTELLGWILAAPGGSFQELVILKPGQYARLAHRLHRVPGLVIRPEQLRLFASIAPEVVGSVGTETSPAFRNQGIAYRPGATVGLSGLQQAYQNQLAGTPTTKVIAENAAGRQVAVLATWKGSTPGPVRTTLDPGVQRAAAAAVSHAGGSAAVVALQASTGHILAAAAHTARGLPRADPLNGRYLPGTAFTIVSAEALLAKHRLTPSSPVRCTRVNGVGGRNFRNVPPVRNLGPQPSFAADFAHTCATAFSGLSLALAPRDLAAAARGFQLGTGWRLPLPAFPGELHAPAGVAQLAATVIGEANVSVSPLAMALIAADVDTGIAHSPVLVTRPGGSHHAARLPLRPSVIATVRQLMRGTVRGAARQADLAGPPVYGQAGTAPLGSGRHQRWAAWFVGYRGDLAFAVLRITTSPSASAVPAAAAFLSSSPLP